MAASAKDPVLIVTGAPGAGKTTVARLLAGTMQRTVHLESDTFFRFIESGYVEPWKPTSHEQNTIVMRIVGGAAAAYAGAGYFTIVDGIISPGWFFEPLRDSLRDAGHRVAYAVLRPPLPVCVSRAEGREPGRLSDGAIVERLWHDFADLGSLERHVIEIDTESPDEVAALLARQLRDGRLSV